MTRDVRVELAEALGTTMTLLAQSRAVPQVDSADRPLHRLATVASARLRERHRLPVTRTQPDEPVIPAGALVMRSRVAVCRGLERAAATGAERPQYFIVTSQGLAGSAWLGSSLNLHPEITCAMGIDHPLVSMAYYYNGDLIQARTDAVEHPDTIRHGFYSETLRRYFTRAFAERGIPFDGNLVRENPVRRLQDMFDELEWFEPQSTYYGNVHVCFAHDAFECLRALPARHDVRLVNLIRHPVTRTEAAIRGVQRHVTEPSDSDWHVPVRVAFDAFADAETALRRDIEARFGVDFTDRRCQAVLYTYYGARHNDCWAGEITAMPDVCHVLIERLLSDRDYFGWLLHELTGHRVVATTEFLDRIYTEQHLHSGRHTGRGPSLGPRDQWQAWTAWERHEFRQAMARLDLANTYAPFGYDFSFVG